MQINLYINKTVLITGASKGIGLHLVVHFIRHGAKVIGFSRNSSSFADTNYEHFNIDIGDNKQVLETIKIIRKKYQCIDILINNAAVLTSQFAMIMSANDAINMINTILLGTFLVSKEVAKQMKKAQYGRIINVSSMAVKLETQGDSVYAACKAAVTTLANIFAKELSSYNITCNTIGVTAIQTDMLAQLPKDKVDKIIANLTIPRYAEMDDIYNVIDFFSSPRSSYITAQTIYLGGIN